MKRILGVAAAMALAIGCRGPSQVYDPFLGRTTVDPPGTATPPPGQPYYGVPPATAPTLAQPPGAAATPMPRYGSPNFSPTPAGGAGLSSSFAPNVSSPTQLTPASASGNTAAPPLTPVSNTTRPSYSPPGASGYPQARAVPITGTPTLAQAASPAASSTNPPSALDVDKILASRGTSLTTPTSGVSTASATDTGDASRTKAAPAAFSSPASTVRIVEPGAKNAPTSQASDAGAAGSTATSSSGGTAPSLFHASGPTASIMPAGAASSGTLGQSLSNAPATGSSASGSTSTNSRVPEITELPPAGTNPAAARAATSSAALSTAAVATPSKSTAGSTSAVYGYDPQYRLLKGSLEYSQSTHQWRLRYIPSDGTTDNYGGSVVLADASKLAGLHPGDFVSVQGSIGAASASQGSFAPLYNVQQVQKQ